MAETVFGLILSGRIPCHKVYEDERVLAFLDINPLSPGHTLVIPKERAETLDRLSEESAAALGRALPRICRAVMEVVGVTPGASGGCNVLQNNGSWAHQEVMHVHFHVIPRTADGRGLGVVWKPMAGGAGFDHAAGASLAARIAALV